MVSLATLLTAYKLYKTGTSVYKAYKRSYKGKKKAKRPQMQNLNIGWTQK